MSLSLQQQQKNHFPIFDLKNAFIYNLFFFVFFSN